MAITRCTKHCTRVIKTPHGTAFTLEYWSEIKQIAPYVSATFVTA